MIGLAEPIEYYLQEYEDTLKLTQVGNKYETWKTEKPKIEKK